MKSRPQLSSPTVPLLFRAIEDGDLNRVTALVGADPNIIHRARDKAQQEGSYEPWLLASIKKQGKIARFLLREYHKLGIEITSQHPDQDGVTELMRAIIEGNVDAAFILMDAGADISACDKQGNTALHYACSRGLAKVCYELIDRESEVDSVNHRGITPFLAVLDLEASADRDEILSRMIKSKLAPEADIENIGELFDRYHSAKECLSSICSSCSDVQNTKSFLTNIQNPDSADALGYQALSDICKPLHDPLENVSDPIEAGDFLFLRSVRTTSLTQDLDRLRETLEADDIKPIQDSGLSQLITNLKDIDLIRYYSAAPQAAVSASGAESFSTTEKRSGL